jgi:protein BCP1
MIIGQNYIGSVLKQCWDDEMSEDEDDDVNVVFGVSTCINLTSRKESECVKQIKSIILEKAEKLATDSTLKMLRDIFTNDSRSTGFIINERFINIPTQICVPLLEGLCKEMKRASEKKMPYNFDYIVMIVKIQRSEDQGKPVENFYSNAEEEYFVENSLASFEYCVKSEIDTGLMGKWREKDQETTPYRKVIVIDGKKLPTIVEGVNTFIHAS